MKSSRLPLPCWLIAILWTAVWAGAATPTTQSSRDRGVQAIAFIDRNFRLPDGLYADDPPREYDKKRGPAIIWPAGVELSALNAAAAVDPARIAAARAYADALSLYITTTRGFEAYAPAPRRDFRYFDDNEWIVLDLVQTYALKNDRAARGYLDRAEETMRFIQSGESDDLGGGVYWREQRDMKNTCSNAPAICCALALSALRPDKSQLDFALRVYTWTNQHLQDADGLYFDHLDANGKVDKTRFSYNTALMIEANPGFYALTRDAKYLVEAQRIAAAAERHWFGEHGALRDESCFAHLLCEALLRLASVDHDDAHVQHVRAALDFLAEHRRADGFYPRYWNTALSPDDRPRLIDQASAARGFLCLARFSGE